MDQSLSKQINLLSVLLPGPAGPADIRSFLSLQSRFGVYIGDGSDSAPRCGMAGKPGSTQTGIVDRITTTMVRLFARIHHCTYNKTKTTALIREYDDQGTHRLDDFLIQCGFFAVILDHVVKVLHDCSAWDSSLSVLPHADFHLLVHLRSGKGQVVVLRHDADSRRRGSVSLRMGSFGLPSRPRTCRDFDYEVKAESVCLSACVAIFDLRLLTAAFSNFLQSTAEAHPNSSKQVLPSTTSVLGTMYDPSLNINNLVHYLRYSRLPIFLTVDLQYTNVSTFYLH